MAIFRYDETEAGLLKILSGREKDVEVRRLSPSAPPEEVADVPRLADPARPGQTLAGRRFRRLRTVARVPARVRIHLIYFAYFDPVTTTRRCRPLRRRRASVFRPALVLMRSRNPCLLMRFRFRGLYVGFILWRPSDRSSLPAFEQSKIPAGGPGSQPLAAGRLRIGETLTGQHPD
jgi:hypothetical protein